MDLDEGDKHDGAHFATPSKPRGASEGLQQASTGRGRTLREGLRDVSLQDKASHRRIVYVDDETDARSVTSGSVSTATFAKPPSALEDFGKQIMINGKVYMRGREIDKDAGLNAITLSGQGKALSAPIVVLLRNAVKAKTYVAANDTADPALCGFRYYDKAFIGVRDSDVEESEDDQVDLSTLHMLPIPSLTTAAPAIPGKKKAVLSKAQPVLQPAAKPSAGANPAATQGGSAAVLRRASSMQDTDADAGED
jgi:hypothetical protein